MTMYIQLKCILFKTTFSVYSMFQYVMYYVIVWSSYYLVGPTLVSRWSNVDASFPTYMTKLVLNQNIYATLFCMKEIFKELGSTTYEAHIGQKL